MPQLCRRFLPALLLVQLFSSTELSGNDNDEKDHRSAGPPVQLIPFVSVKADMRGLIKANEFCDELTLGDSEYSIFEWTGILGEPLPAPDASDPRKFRFEGYLAKPLTGSGVTLGADMVLPGDHEKLLELLQDSGTDNPSESAGAGVGRIAGPA